MSNNALDTLPRKFVDRIFQAEAYLRDGIPLKDAMDQDEVDEAILELADALRAEGWQP